MKILLTGATGFIGSHLVKKLIDKYEVLCLVPSSDIGIKEIQKDVEVKFADLTNYDLVKKIVKEISPNILIHLAAVTPVRYSFEMPDVYQDVNYLATINLVHSILKLPSFKKFIFASTMETYGWQPEKKPFKENLALNPASPYAVSKVAAENYIKMAGKAFGLPYLIAKPCNTFGRKDNTSFIIEYLITQMLKSQTPCIGTPNAVRDLMYIDDHVNAYLKLLEFEMGNYAENQKMIDVDPSYFIFNFGNSLEFRIKEVASKIKNLICYNGEFVYSFPSSYPSRPVIEEYLSVDSSKAKKILKWSPKVSLNNGLKKTIKYWKEFFH